MRPGQPFQGELGDEIVGQLFSMDRVLIMVGAALSVLGILTPLYKRISISQKSVPFFCTAYPWILCKNLLNTEEILAEYPRVC